MNEKLEEFTWKVRAFFTCVGYDIGSTVLRMRIGFMRLRIAIARRAVEVLKDEL